MGTTADKLQKVLDSKNAIRDKFKLADNLPFSQYADNISSGADVILGVVDAQGNFQPFEFQGIEATNSGYPEGVSVYYTWDSTLPAPDMSIGDLSFITATAEDILAGKIGADTEGNPVEGLLVKGTDVSDTTATASDVRGGKQFYNSAGVLTTGTLVPQSGGGSATYYKCSAVDTNNNTWTGYKAYLVEDTENNKTYYDFETTATTGLIYNMQPTVGCIYNETADIKASFVPADSSILLYAQMKIENSVPTGQVMSEISPVDALPQGDGYVRRTAVGTFYNNRALFFPCLLANKSEFTIMFRCCVVQESNMYFYGESAVDDWFRVLIDYDRNGEHKLAFCIRNQTTGNQGTRSDLYSQTVIEKYQWYDVCCVYSSTEQTIYINGVQDARTDGGTAMTAETSTSLIGDYSASGAAYISDVLTLDRAISETELQFYLNR